MATEIQKRITDWCELCFGAEHMASPLIRGLRLLEEALEFAQAVDVPPEKCLSLVEYVYSRPKGTPPQELGGVGVCLHAAASSIGESTDELVEREISRCEAKPPAHFTARNQVKVDAGFDALPSGDSTQPAGAVSSGLLRYMDMMKETNPPQGDVVCGVKIMGNMVWFMDSSEPPRQVSPLERKLITAMLAMRGAPAQEREEAARKAMQELNPPENWPEHYAEAMVIIEGYYPYPVDRRHLVAMRAERLDNAGARAARELRGEKA